MKISFDRIISGTSHILMSASLFLLVPFSLAVSSCDLTIKPIKIENDGNGQDDTDDDQGQDPEVVTVQKVLITFSGDTFTVPLVYGPDFSEGKIFWGDDSEEAYKEGASHDYSSAGEYVVTMEVPDAETIELQNLIGVSHLDLSGF